MTVLAAQFGSGQVFWSLFWLTLFFLWVWLSLVIIANVVGRDDLNGPAKAVWIAVVLLVPFLGAITYVAQNGDALSEKAERT
jgi:hypothetical protein